MIVDWSYIVCLHMLRVFSDNEILYDVFFFFFFFQAEDGIRDGTVTGVQTCALPIFHLAWAAGAAPDAARVRPLDPTSAPGPQRHAHHSREQRDRPELRRSQRQFVEIGRASCRERV